MPRYRVQFTLPATTEIPRDAVVSTWHIQAADVEDVVLASQAIWENWFQEIGDWISPAMSRASQVRVRIYDLAHSEPRTPVVEGNAGGLPASSQAAGLPVEVAVCVSLEAAGASGTNAGRRRGRMYVGPLIADSLTQSGSYARPATGLISTLAFAAENTGEAINALERTWCIYSRADDQFRPVVRGWIDDEFDTQRRRGRDAADRAIFVLGDD